MHHVCVIGVASALGISTRHFDTDFRRLFHSDDFRQALTHHHATAHFKHIKPALPKTATPTLNDSQLTLDLLSEYVCEALDHNKPFISIEGDHSAAMGCWRPVAERCQPGELGLIWLDAHMDAHSFQSSPTGNLHGMPVCTLIGQGCSRLQRLYHSQAFIEPSNMVLIGIRDYEPEEKALLDAMGVQIIYMRDITSPNALQEAITHSYSLLASRCSAIGMSIDLDVFNPEKITAVATPVINGIEPEDFIACINTLDDQQKLVGIEIAEYYSALDTSQLSACFITTLIDAFLPKLLRH